MAIWKLLSVAVAIRHFPSVDAGPARPARGIVRVCAFRTTPVSNLPPTTPYPIGTPGTPWGDAERAAWLARQQIKRSYADEVVAPLQARVPPEAELLQYGTLDYTRLGLAR